MSDSSADFRELERRLREVESLVTFLQRAADDFHAVILEQQRQLEAQNKELSRLSTMFMNFADPTVQAPRSLEDEKPPHY